MEIGAAGEGYDMDKFWQDRCKAQALGAQLREGDDMYESSDAEKDEEDEGGGKKAAD